MTFGTVGCWPAGPIRPPGPWCLGPARGVPRPAPGRTSWAGLGKVRSWFLRCSEGDVWHRGLLARGPDPSSRAMVFGPCEGGPSTRAGPHFMGWFREGSKLVSTVFRLAPWAAGPRARSVLQAHGVWPCEGGPSTRAGPHFMGRRGSRDPFAGPKHHGPGGRIGPAGQQPTVPNVTF